MSNRRKAEYISKCLELAMLLEVSAFKPGNVTPTASFKDTKIEHFLASAVAVRSRFKIAALRGKAVANSKLSVRNVRVGQIIKECISDINMWQKGGNTLLGTIILFVPIAVAAGMTSGGENLRFDFSKLRKNLRLVVESTTAEDSVNLYKAIDLAKPSGLGVAPDFDVTDPGSKKRLIEDDIPLIEVFKISAGYDEICSEWVNNYTITFDLAFPYLTKQLERTDLGVAVVQTFLKIMSEHPDTFIARKANLKRAREISLEAKKILDLGGLETFEGKKRIVKLDRVLRASGNRLNPGTTADLTGAALALCVLEGYRP